MKFLLILIVVFVNLWGGIAKVSIAQGDISLLRKNQTAPLKTGMILEEHDKIESRSGNAQLLFNDGTVISLGNKSIFSIDEYSQDEKKPSAKFGVTQGAFKAITGQIGKIAPDKFKIATKTATIGIRGTRFLGVVEDSGEKIACTKGEIIVTREGVSVNVPHGFIVSLKSQEKTISTPKPFTPTEIKEMETKTVTSNEKKESSSLMVSQETEKSSDTTLKTLASSNVSETLAQTVSQVNENTKTHDLKENSDSVAESFSLIGRAQALFNGAFYDNNFTVSYDNTLSKLSSTLPLSTSIVSAEQNQSIINYNNFYQNKGNLANNDFVGIKTFALDGIADEYVSWGAWSAISSSEKYVNATWYAGQTLTPSTLIEQYIANNQQVTYTGKIAGYISSSDGLALIDRTTSIATVNVNFGTSTVSGNLSMNYSQMNHVGTVVSTGNAVLNLSGGGIIPSTSSFTSTISSGTGMSDVSGSVTGNFYGSSAQAIGANFNALYTKDSINYNVSGTIKGAKQ